MASIQRQQAAKRLKAALNRRFEPQANTVQAGPLGSNQIYAAGQIYTGGVTGVTEVVNVGRPAAAVYVAKGSGGTTVVANKGGSGSSGGGSGLPTDGSGAMTGNLNMGGNNITNVGLVDGVDVGTFYSDYLTHNHDALYVNVTGDNMTGALTILGNTVWHAGNDGAGSGLDADLWDGNQFASYLNQPVRTSDAVQFLSVTTPTVSAASTLTLSPTTDIILDPAGDDVILNPSTRIGTNNFVSGTTGWRVDYAGNADFRDIFADTLTVETFISDVNLALAGSQIIVKSLGILANDFTVPTTSDDLVIFDLPGFNDSQSFEEGDWVRLRYVERGTGLVVGDAWGTVAGYTDEADAQQSWTWTRQSGTVGKTIYGGMVALDYGQSGDGYIHLTTLQDDSPYLDVATWVTDPSNPANHTVHVRLGNLDGITASGLNPGGWGLYADNVFLEGDLIAGGGDAVANASGMTIKAESSTSWATFPDKLTFATVPTAPTRLNTAGQLYGIKQTSSSPTYNQLYVASQAGDSDNADYTQIYVQTLDPTNSNLAQIRLETDTDSGDSSIRIWADDATGQPGNISMLGHVLINDTIRPTSAGGADIGTAGNPFDKIYANQLVVSTVSSGPAQSGDIWQHDASDMYIRSNSASPRTLYVANPGSGTMHLDVEGNITTGGTVDGVDISALASSITGHNHDDRYYTETESDARFVRGVSAGTGITVSGSLAGYTVSHSDTSALGAGVQGAGIPWVAYNINVDTYGHVQSVGFYSLDARYFTETEADARFAPISHSHNDLYYTEAEVDALIASATVDTGDISGNLTVAGYIAVGDPAQTVIDANRRFYVAPGTEALPGLSFVGDTDTGMYRVGSNQIGFSTAGVQRLEINDTTTSVIGALEVGNDITALSDIYATTVYADNFEADVQVLTPTLSFASDDSVKVYSPVADQLRITLGTDNAIFNDVANFLFKETTISDLIAQTATIYAASFEPVSAGPPFYLNSNAQGQLVTGLRADQLNKSVTAGDGLSGGGTLTSDVSLAVDSTVARRNAVNNFTAYQQITAVTPALYLTNSTPITWGMINAGSALGFYYEGSSKFNITSSGDITIGGGLTVDSDTLYVDKTTDAVWINSGTPNGSATLKVTSGFADDTTAVFKAASSQSAYIWEVQDSAGDGLIGIDASGNLQSLSNGFVSGRSGWRITPDGNAEFNNLVARGEIRTAVFVKDEIAVDSGSHLFAEGALTLTAFTSGSGTLTLNIKDTPYEHARIFNVGDNLIMRSGGVRDYNQSTGPNINEPWNFFAPRPGNAGSVLVATQVFLTVTGYTDEGTYYSYEVVKQSGPVVTFPENTTVVSYGQGDSGLIGIFADQNYGPYLDVFLPGATPWNMTPVTPLRLGRLDGLGLSELATEQYGIAISTDLSDSSAGRIIASDQQFLINNVDFTVTDGASTILEIDAEEPSFYVGTDASLPTHSSQISFNKTNEFGGITLGNPNNSYISIDNAIIGGQATIGLSGNVSIGKSAPDNQAAYGRVYIGSPIAFTHDGGESTLQGGFAAGTFETDDNDIAILDQMINGIRLWRDTFTTTRMAGYVEGAESWSVNAAGDWSYANGEVQINGGGIQITASNIFDDEESQNQLRWLATDGTIVGAINGFEAETLSTSSGIAVSGYAAATNSLVSLNAETPESAGSISISALLSGSSTIQLNATEVFAANALRVGDRLILMPISDVEIHPTGATMYLDAASGDLKVLFANAVTKTLATN